MSTPGKREALRPLDWLVLAPAVGLAPLGALFILAPRAGAALFGLPAPEPPALGYLPALGLRDVALGGYVLALGLARARCAVGLVLAVTMLIPLGGLALLAALRSPATSTGHMLLHGASGAYIAAAALWMLRRPG